MGTDENIAQQAGNAPGDGALVAAPPVPGAGPRLGDGPRPGRDNGPPPGVRDRGPPPGATGMGPPPGGDPGPPPGHGPAGDAFAIPRVTAGLIGYFWRFARPDRHKLAASCAIVALSAALPVAMMLLPWWLSSHWSPQGRALLLLGIGLLLGLNLLGMALQMVNAYVMAYVAEGFVRRVRTAIFAKIGSLPSESMSFQAVGALSQRITGDVMRIRELLTPGFVQGLTYALQLVLMLVALLVIEPAWGAIVVILLPAVWWGVSRVGDRVKSWARQDQLQQQTIMTRFIEAVGGYRDWVAAGRFSHAITQFDRELVKKQKISVTTSLWNSAANFIPMLAFLLLVFGYYITKVSNTAALADFAKLGKVLSVAGLIGMARQPALELFRLITETALSAPSLYEVKSLLDAPEVADVARGRAPASGALEFRGVSFGYRGPPVLRDVTFQIDPGDFAAIVGQSGSGKTTLFHLLLRMIEPGTGEVCVGGVPLREMSLADLREFIGFIPQSPFIFDGTIKENLLMGVPEAQFDPQRIVKAVQLARLDALVERRRDIGGLDAPVGAGGMSLSAGERQRVALGRIFLRDPQIIVCDEYTANIDNATAKLVQQALATTFAGKTRVVITHQLYTVRGAEKIVVLDQGRVVDQGAHADLLARAGLYRDMWDVQRLE